MAGCRNGIIISAIARIVSSDGTASSPSTTANPCETVSSQPLASSVLATRIASLVLPALPV